MGFPTWWMWDSIFSHFIGFYPLVLAQRFVDWVDDMVSVYNTSSFITIAACGHIRDMHALYQAHYRPFSKGDPKGGLDIN